MCTVVYNASPGCPALETVEFLRARGLSPETLDDPNPDPAVMYASAQTYVVRIAVPKSEVHQALRFLQAREAGRNVLIERATAQLRWQAALAWTISMVVIASILMARGGLASYPLHELMAIFCVGCAVGTLFMMLIIAQVTERLTRRDSHDAPQCHACGYILLGLTEPRCPECGYPFHPSQLALNDATTSDQEEVSDESPSQ